MVDKELKRYHMYQRFLRILLTMCGCWYMPTKSRKSYYWTVCALLVTILYLTLNVHLSYIYRHNLVIMMKHIGVAISSIGAILKIGTFLINRRSLINYHQTLNDLFEEELTRRNKKIQTIMFSSLSTICTLAYTYSGILIVLMVAFFMPTYLFIIRDLCHFHLTTNYTLPVSRGQGYFWIVPHNFLYHLHLLLETGGVSFICITACSTDSVFGFYVYLSSSTMHAMTFRLTNPLPTEKFSDILRTCVAKHQKLLQCRDTLEHVYGTIIFWHIVTNAVLLCSLIYEVMSFSNFNVSILFKFLTYATIKLLQTFIYAWYGTVLTKAGEDFRKGIYFGNWLNSDLDCHMRTNIILTLMQKPMAVKTFFSSVDMIMFTNFVNTTMSYFFLLQSISDKGE